MHKTGIALGLLIAAGALGVIAPWYTGTQLEGTLQASISQSNAQLREALPGAGASMELLSLERGIFSSTARYRINLGDALSDDGTPVELLFSDRIEHGPLPLSRLQAMQFQPVMAASRFNLELTDAVLPWFTSSGGAAPLTGTLALGYDESVTGRIRLQPLEVASAEGNMRFSGLDLDVALGAQAASVRLNGGMDNLSFELARPEGAVQIRLSGLTLSTDHRLGASGFYVGGSRLALARTEVLAEDQPALLMQDFVQTDRIEERGQSLGGSVDYTVGALSYAGKPLGSVRLGMSVANLDVAALQQLEGWYKEFLARLETAEASAALADTDEARLRQSLEALLAGKPSLSLDRLSLKTANGESSFNLRFDLARPQSFELPPPELARQFVSRLDARLVLAKPMIRDLITYQASLEPQVDPVAVARQAAEAAEMAGMMATSMQVGRVEGDNIVTSLSYADGQVDFNGQVMPVEEFAGLLMAMAPPQAMGLMSGAVEAGGMGGLGEEPVEMRGLLEPEADAVLEAEQGMDASASE